MIFKDEVRRVGASMGIDKELLGRHPFPGPGLGNSYFRRYYSRKSSYFARSRCYFYQWIKRRWLYDKVWQAGAMLLPVNSVGVMGDERTYEKVVALRAVESTDGMTADWVIYLMSFCKKL